MNRFLVCCLICLLTTSVSAVDLLRPKYRYDNAYRRAERQNKHLVVVVGATWCPPCNRYKSAVVERLALRDITGMAKFCLAYIDWDQHPKYRKQFRGDTDGIPYTVVYTRQKNGSFKTRKIQGEPTLDQLLKYIRN